MRGNRGKLQGPLPRVPTCKGSFHCLVLTHGDVPLIKRILIHKGTPVFSSGGDQTLRISDRYIDKGGFGRLNALGLQFQMHCLPKLVIAQVAVHSIGHDLLIGDIMIAADTSVLAKLGKKVGNLDVGYGCSTLFPLVDLKQARKIRF